MTDDEPTNHPALRLPDERAVAVAGDWHGEGNIARIAIERAAELGAHTILHAGDLGIGPWPRDTKSYTKLLDRYLQKAGSVLLVTPGNHENYARLDAAPRDEAGMIVLGRHLRALPRGHRWTQGGRRFGALGGAVSVDKMGRREGQSWWPREKPHQEDADTLGDAPLDVLLTHDAPAGVELISGRDWTPPSDILAESNAVRDLLRQAVERTGPAIAFSGHWHQRVTGELRREDGGATRVEVLAHEKAWAGNAVLLDLETLAVRSLAEAWRAAR